tara:strand:+ start:257 stop:1132 length:876 start_codon:yes stop_codon:yes gene_type:complete
MKVCLVTLFFAFSVYASDKDVFNQLALQEEVSKEDKLLFWSNYFLGKPYDSSGPLGEGTTGLYDRDPLYRFDAFDCTTFVETLIALANSSDKQTFSRVMNEVRYKEGKVSYLNRNHIISQSWIPNNIDNSLIRRSTSYFSDQYLEFGSSIIDLANWLKFHKVDSLKLPDLSEDAKAERLNQLKQEADRFSQEEVFVEYLSTTEVLKDWQGFKNELNKKTYILNIVRPNWQLKHLIGTNLNISHQGILEVAKDGIYFIHASSAGMVKKVLLKSYLDKIKDSSTIRGFSLFSL